MTHLNKKTVCWSLCLLLAGAPLLGQTVSISKREFYGTWKMNHDGWEGKLIINGAGTTSGLSGKYVGADGRIHALSGEADGHKITFRLDLADTAGNSGDDQIFEGYLFTQSRQGMAGTTSWGNTPYAWYAVKESEATTLPPPPTTVSDQPDPAGASQADVQGGSLAISLSTSKENYVPGETVRFILEATGNGPQTRKLENSYYKIFYLHGQDYREFFTSDRGAFGRPKIGPGEKANWSWDQWDNERQNKAQAGEWKIKVFLTQTDTILEKKFKIKNP